MNTIQELKDRIRAKQTEMNQIDIKIKIYAERDWLAAEAYLRQWQKLDLQLLDMMTTLQELEVAAKPIDYTWDLTTEDQAVS